VVSYAFYALYIQLLLSHPYLVGSRLPPFAIACQTSQGF
jgi:hypothetical protein